jgi:hypothetical protein
VTEKAPVHGRNDLVRSYCSTCCGTPVETRVRQVQWDDYERHRLSHSRYRPHGAHRDCCAVSKAVEKDGATYL